MPRTPVFRLCLALSAGLWLAGCASQVSLSDRDCMARVLYFESNRSSPEGMLAVGTTVMNRLEAPGFPKTVCGVVGQPRQFAAGVLDKRMNPREAALAVAVADRVLAGERHPQVGGAMFFHTAGLTFPYKNMHYVLVAGGNAFYEKRRGPEREPQDGAPPGFASQPPQPTFSPSPDGPSATVPEAAEPGPGYPVEQADAEGPPPE